MVGALPSIGDALRGPEYYLDRALFQVHFSQGA